MTMKCDISKFRAALRAVQRDAKKPEAEIVNKALKDVAFRTASFTPKTAPGMIRRQLQLGRGGLLPALASMACNRKYGVKGWNRAQHSATMLSIVTRRVRGAAAVRAGWIPAILALGGSYRGAKLNPNGSAAKGTAQKATISRLMGLIRNAVKTADAHGKESGAGDIPVATLALRKAIVFVTRDRELYAERKRGIGKVLAKHSK